MSTDSSLGSADHVTLLTEGGEFVPPNLSQLRATYIDQMAVDFIRQARQVLEVSERLDKVYFVGNGLQPTVTGADMAHGMLAEYMTSLDRIGNKDTRSVGKHTVTDALDYLDRNGLPRIKNAVLLEQGKQVHELNQDPDYARVSLIVSDPIQKVMKEEEDRKPNVSFERPIFSLQAESPTVKFRHLAQAIMYHRVYKQWLTERKNGQDVVPVVPRQGAVKSIEKAVRWEVWTGIALDVAEERQHTVKA